MGASVEAGSQRSWCRRVNALGEHAFVACSRSCFVVPQRMAWVDGLLNAIVDPSHRCLPKLDRGSHSDPRLREPRRTTATMTMSNTLAITTVAPMVTTVTIVGQSMGFSLSYRTGHVNK